MNAATELKLKRCGGVVKKHLSRLKKGFSNSTASMELLLKRSRSHENI